MNKTILMLVILLQTCFLTSIILIPQVSATEDSWTSLEPMPTARSGVGAAVVDGKIYVIGGSTGAYLNTNEMYDPETDTWTTKTPMPTKRGYFGIAVYQDKIYVFGGWGFHADVGLYGVIGTTEAYDPSSDTWETKASLPTPRESVCASVVGDKIYLIGGYIYAKFPILSDKNEIYDPETDTWTTGAPLPDYLGMGYLDVTSAVVDNKIYMICDSFNQMYDPETDIWSYRAEIPTPIIYYSAGATTGEYAPKRIHVLGTITHQIYKTETDSWITGSPAPTPRDSMGVAVINDEIYAIGGHGSTAVSAVNEKYTPSDYIPEFPSLVIMLFLVVSTVVVLILKKRLTKL